MGAITLEVVVQVGKQGVDPITGKLRTNTITDGRQRVTIEGVAPEIDGGRFAIKRVIGESVVVEADIFTDGHDAIDAVLLYRRADESAFHSTPMKSLVNDRWQGEFTVDKLGRYVYTLWAWVDPYKTWVRDLKKRLDADQDVSVERIIGADLVDGAAERASGERADELRRYSAGLRDGDRDIEQVITPRLNRLMVAHSDRSFATRYAQELVVVVDPELARFSAWYELFPRSWSVEPGRHGTFKDVIQHLSYVSQMGFDVLYLPPIHPIGETFRKGPNNSVTADADDVGSPWAIGSDEGGHKSIHSELGTLEDFKLLVDTARNQGIEIALDIAFQCSPDHPYVQEHSEWFKQRPDGTIQYAENPPKKYQDIYPFNFETEDWRGLWDELKSVVEYWIDQGVRVFRVDNPHTKPLRFWEWLINDIKKAYPETIFLAEAFTRPKVMYHLAKLGFSQSYNYFPWRNTRWELTEYLTEVTQTEVSEYFRPNLWPNTPDILPQYLQFGGRPASITRLILAATLGASYGIYGPVYELGENVAAPGREENIDSEKYEIRNWDLEAPHSLSKLIAQLNSIRRSNPALQANRGLRFHSTDNDQLIAYSKESDDGQNLILTIVNVDSHYTQSGWLELPLEELGIETEQPFQVHDLLGQGRYLWQGPRNYIEIHPHALPGHIFRVRRKVRTEEDFDYFM